MLVGLMLSLSFAKVISDIRSIDNAIVREAAAILDVSYDLNRYKHDDTREIQLLLVQYTESVLMMIGPPWPMTAWARKQLHSKLNCWIVWPCSNRQRRCRSG